MHNTQLVLNNKKLRLAKSKLNLEKNDILIEVKSCGICGSDLKILEHGSSRVKNGTIMGHEVSGKIINLKKNNSQKNIILGADIPMINEENFAIGHEIDGGFQKFLKIKKKFFNKIPNYITKKKINYDLASLSEPVACCLNGFERMSFQKNKNVVIFGAGPIGYIIAALSLYFRSKKVFIIDSNQKRLNLGIINKKLFKLSLKNYKKKILKILNKTKEQIDYGFVACNSAKAQNEILKLVKEKGTVNYFSGLKNKKKKVNVNLNTNLIHYKQLNLVGSHGSTKKNLLKAAKLIVGKKINLSKIITNKYNIKNHTSAFKKFKSGSSLKVIINP